MPTYTNGPHSFTLPEKLPYRLTANYMTEQERLSEQYKGRYWGPLTSATAAQNVGLITGATFEAVTEETDTDLVSWVGGTVSQFVADKLDIPKA